MNFTLKMDCDNAEFDERGVTNAVARILREVAATVSQARHPRNVGGTIRDVNGNRIGDYSFTD